MDFPKTYTFNRRKFYVYIAIAMCIALILYIFIRRIETCFFIVFLILLIPRFFLAKWHRLGMKRLGESNFEEARNCFNKMYFMMKSSKVLRHLELFLLANTSDMTYAEISLCNIAYTYVAQNDIQNAVIAYNRVLEEFPANVMAKSTLKLIEEARKNS